MPAIGISRGEVADILIFDHERERAMMIELIDGDTFDIKKSSGELDSMNNLTNWLSNSTNYDSAFFFCSFNQTDKQAVVKGAKGRFDIAHALTGCELCELLSIDYDARRRKRQEDQLENHVCFI